VILNPEQREAWEASDEYDAAIQAAEEARDAVYDEAYSDDPDDGSPKPHWEEYHYATVERANDEYRQTILDAEQAWCGAHPQSSLPPECEEYALWCAEEIGEICLSSVQEQFLREEEFRDYNYANTVAAPYKTTTEIYERVRARALDDIETSGEMREEMEWRSIQETYDEAVKTWLATGSKEAAMEWEEDPPDIDIDEWKAEHPDPSTYTPLYVCE